MTILKDILFNTAQLAWSVGFKIDSRPYVYHVASQKKIRHSYAGNTLTDHNNTLISCYSQQELQQRIRNRFNIDVFVEPVYINDVTWWVGKHRDLTNVIAGYCIISSNDNRYINYNDALEEALFNALYAINIQNLIP